MARRTWILAFVLYFYLKELGVSFTEIVVKYVLKDIETIRLTCPPKHVIFNPQFQGGAFNTKLGTNCTGVSPDIRERLDKCHFRMRCEIEIRKSDWIFCDKSQRRIDFVEISQPYCIPTGKCQFQVHLNPILQTLHSFMEFLDGKKIGKIHLWGTFSRLVGLLVKPRKDMNNVNCRRDMTEILLKAA